MAGREQDPSIDGHIDAVLPGEGTVSPAQQALEASIRWAQQEPFFIDLSGSFTKEADTDLRIALISENPVYQTPSLSRPARKANPAFSHALVADLTDEIIAKSDLAPLFREAGRNPALQVLTGHRVSLLGHVPDSQTHAHQELLSSIAVVRNLTLAEIMNGVFDPADTENTLGWPRVASAVQGHLKAA